MFPDDATLIARGKYSTLNKERKEQLERVQTICKTIMANANPVLRDCECRPPKDMEALATLDSCVKNALKARTRLIELCEQMAEIEPLAWPK
jgi:hypothetical protein